MIRCNLAEVLKATGRNLHELHRETGIAYSTLFNMARGKTARYDGPTLDRICAALGCTLGDILEYVPD